MRKASLLFVLAVALAAPSSAAAIGTGFADDFHFGDPSRNSVGLDRARAAGAKHIRLTLYWSGVVPATRPAGFNPGNPNDPAYNWAGFDQQVRAATSRGLQPLVLIFHAPQWATGPGPGGAGVVRPDPVQLGHFARAAALRYSGRSGQPRVRNWMVWNEPNRDYFLMPQFENGSMASAARYRQMVASMGNAVRTVDPTNRVIAGGLAPLGRPGKPAPLAFMRNLFCVSLALKRTCDLRSNPVRFDVWSHHPYTSGGPMHKAAARDDVALGDLPAMRKLLQAAVRLGQVRGRGSIGFWVTEFSWDSNPPDPKALGANLHARWTSEALYRMWQHGVRVVIWFRIQDDPLSVSPYQSGFFMANGARKRSFTAFRFPTVALTNRNGIFVWGRTPTSRGGQVVIQVKTGKSWRRLGVAKANGNGVFQKTFRTPIRKGHVRARFANQTSLPFSLTYAKNRYVNPFGCGGGIPC